jgi:hypothetical protein
VDAFQFDHDEFKTQDETDLVSNFLQNLQDWGDMSTFAVDFEIRGQIQLGYTLNAEIDKLEKAGFYIFGERRHSLIKNSDNADICTWDIATIVIIRKENPSIVDGVKLSAILKPLNIG